MPVDFASSGCFLKYNCGSLKKPESGHVLAPWVTVTFKEGNGKRITVGNLSSSELDNSAVIKSFDFGFSTGSECKIVIHDTQGSSMHIFVQNMMKELIVSEQSDRLAKVQWGWGKTGCGKNMPANSSKSHFLLINWIETNFIQGKFIHEITLTDTLATAHEGGVEKIFGGDGHKNALTLKKALKEVLMSEPAPIVSSVKFQRLENGKAVESVTDPKTGKTSDAVNFKYFKDGIESRFSGNASNKFEAARNWAGCYLTDREKCVKMFYNTEVDNGEVIFWEIPVYDCNKTMDAKNCIGTYIVNGGKDSSVIEFNPRIKWTYGGYSVVGGNVPTNTIKARNLAHQKAYGVLRCPELRRPEIVGAGQTLSITTPDGAKDSFMHDATTVVQEGQAMSIYQDNIIIMDGGIRADMVIVGDPKFPTQADGVIYGLFISIVFVNPFHLIADEEEPCGEWMANPPCNEFLSNKNWLIERVNHKIQDGTYTTTLGLWLAAPGVDVKLDIQVGDSPTGDIIISEEVKNTA